MKKIFSILLCGCLSAFTLTSCMDEHDDPNTDDLLITSPVSIASVNVDGVAGIGADDLTAIINKILGVVA